MRIPEARHNLRLIAEDCKVQLEGLAREARSMSERKRWIEAEDLRLRKKIEQEADRKLLVVIRPPELTLVNSHSTPTSATSGCGRNQLEGEGNCHFRL